MTLWEFFQTNTFDITMHFVILLFILLSLILSLGVVWQAERKLDTVYKLLTIGIGALAVAELLAFFETTGVLNTYIIQKLFQLVFVIFMTLSLGTMSKTLREIWKEK